MEKNKIVQEYEGKTIFITGATGFLAKILIEKLLRIQPNVKKLFLLIRASDAPSAEKRLREEIFDSELFRVLREIWGENITSFLSSKVIAISGDVSHENLGIADAKLADEICGQTEFIVNVAAATRFDERYDVAMNINTFGTMNVLNFAKRCPKLKLFLHVSTAFLHGTKAGLLSEEAFEMGEALIKGAPYLDIVAEKKLADETRARLEAQNMNGKELAIALRELAKTRANCHGWPNAYSFTKAMGEMLLGNFKDDINVVIIRPTIILSTYKDPFPGWVEGLKTMDSIFAAYGAGKLKQFIGDPSSILDFIPGDMVVNCIIVAMTTQSNAHSNELSIYQLGSSLRNPIKFRQVYDFMYQYLKENPVIDDKGKPINVPFFSSFGRHIETQYKPFLKALKLVNVIFCNQYRDLYTNYKRKLSRAMRLAELYEPYLFFQGTFDDANTEILRRATRENNANADTMLDFNPRSIQWEDYLIKTHFPGVVKYALKQ